MTLYASNLGVLIKLLISLLENAQSLKTCVAETVDCTYTVKALVCSSVSYWQRKESELFAVLCAVTPWGQGDFTAHLFPL